RRKLELASNDQLLLVAARERSRGKRGVRWTDVEFTDDEVGATANRLVVQQNSAKAADHRRPIVHAQNCVLREGELQKQTAGMPVLWYVCDAGLATAARVKRPDVPPAE